MRKVYSLQDNHNLKNFGLIYPTEIEGTFSIPFYIEGSENGKIDDEYEMEIGIYKGKGKWKENPGNLILKRVKGSLFKVEYKDCTVNFRARRSKFWKEGKWFDKKYVGKLKGPQSPLWVLSVTEKEWNDEFERLYDQYHVILIGHIERPEKD